MSAFKQQGLTIEFDTIVYGLSPLFNPLSWLNQDKDTLFIHLNLFHENLLVKICEQIDDSSWIRYLGQTEAVLTMSDLREIFANLWNFHQSMDVTVYLVSVFRRRTKLHERPGLELTSLKI